jgi:hypothetical protein
LNVSVVRSSLLDLDNAVNEAREAKAQIEAHETGRSLEGSLCEYPEVALVGILTDLRDTLIEVLEAAELPETRARLLQQAEGWSRSGGIGQTHHNEQYDFLECPSFEYIARLVKTLRIISGEALTSVESYELAKLETVLRKTAMLLHLRGIAPSSEMDVQNVMHDHLTACFTEYKHPITTAGTIKNFKPDGGVRDLKAAIEFKFASTREEAAKSLGGIFEDAGGYKGSLDWTRFYSVIYQTEAFELEDRIRAEMTRAGLITWKTILVTGAGKRVNLNSAGRC